MWRSPRPGCFLYEFEDKGFAGKAIRKCTFYRAVEALCGFRSFASGLGEGCAEILRPAQDDIVPVGRDSAVGQDILLCIWNENERR
jgi:hypothetical protein